MRRLRCVVPQYVLAGSLVRAEFWRAVGIERSRNHPERALVFLRRKTELSPHDAAAWREQALLTEALGLFTESVDAWEQMLLWQPGDPEASDALRRVRAAQRARPPVSTRPPGK